MCTARAPRGPLTAVVSFFNTPHAHILYVLLLLFFSVLTLQPFFDIFLRTYRDKHRMSSFDINIKALYFPFRLILGQRVEGVCVLGVSSAMSRCCKCRRHPSCYLHPELDLWRVFLGGGGVRWGGWDYFHWNKSRDCLKQAPAFETLLNQNRTESTPVSRCCRTWQGELTWWIGVTFSQEPHAGQNRGFIFTPPRKSSDCYSC